MNIFLIHKTHESIMDLHYLSMDIYPAIAKNIYQKMMEMGDERLRVVKDNGWIAARFYNEKSYQAWECHQFNIYNFFAELKDDDEKHVGYFNFSLSIHRDEHNYIIFVLEKENQLVTIK